MVGEFALAIERWAEFYKLVGSAAFTLLGLIFIAVSINLELIAKPTKSEDLTAFSSQIYLNFLSLTLISLVFMIPRQTPYGLGIPLLLIGLIETLRTARLWRKFEIGYKGQRLLDVSQFRMKLLIPNTMCYLVLIFISLNLIMGSTYYLDWMTMVVIWLLLAGSISAWILMLRLAALNRNSRLDD